MKTVLHMGIEVREILRDFLVEGNYSAYTVAMIGEMTVRDDRAEELYSKLTDRQIVDLAQNCLDNASYNDELLIVIENNIDEMLENL